MFKRALCLDIDNVNSYMGRVHDKPDGAGWHILNNSAMNNLLAAQCFFYNDGDHFLIRNDSIRKTIIARIHGLYIYREEVIEYKHNPQLCDEVIRYLCAEGKLDYLKPKTLLMLARFTDDTTACEVVKSILDKGMNKDAIEFALNLITRGVRPAWPGSLFLELSKYANPRCLELIYGYNSTLHYSIDQLLKIDRDKLTSMHRQSIEDYLSNVEAKRNTIREITGEITTKGLRERAKQLPSDETTKEFSKLCGQLIGHVNIDLDDATLEQLEKWHKDALRLKEISIVIERRLEKLN